MQNIKLVIFDMDGTIIRNTDSVSLLCNINNAETNMMNKINEKENNRIISWIEADYERAKLINGLQVSNIYKEFNERVILIQGLNEIMTYFKNHNILTILITSGPKQVAKIIAEKYKFDYYFGSNYEIIKGKFTDKIINHIGSKGKVELLKQLCNRLKISLINCVAIGDSLSDIDILKIVGCSIAINYSIGLEEYSTYSVFTENINDILPYIINYDRELSKV